MATLLILGASASMGLIIAIAPAGMVLFVAAGVGVAALAIGYALFPREAAATAVQQGSQLDAATLWSFRLFIPLTALGQQTEGASVVMLIIFLALAVGPNHVSDRTPFSLPASILLAISGALWLLDGSIRALLLIVAIFLFAFVCARLERDDFPRAFTGVLDSVAIYLGLNLAGYYLLGLRSPAEAFQMGTAASTAGFLHERLTFPFSAALLTPAAMAAAYITGYVSLIRLSPRENNLIRMAAVAGAVFILIAANGRTPLLAAIILGCGVLFKPNSFPRFAPVVAGLALLLPLWWPLFSSIAGPAIVVIPERIEYLNRGDPEDVLTLQNRTEIWSPVLKSIVQDDLWHLLVGYGPRGQIGSGVYQDYKFLFQGGLVDPAVASSHNSLLQQVLDAGVLGLAALVLTLISTLTIIVYICRRLACGATFCALGMATSLCATAGTDIGMTSTVSQETFWLFAVIAVLGLSYKRAIENADIVLTAANVPPPPSTFKAPPTLRRQQEVP